MGIRGSGMLHRGDVSISVHTCILTLIAGEVIDITSPTVSLKGGGVSIGLLVHACG